MTIQTSGRSKSGSGHIEYIEVLRVLSMLSVVFLHIAASYLRRNYGSGIWHFSNILTSVMGIAVPVFFMISGAVLLSSQKTLSIEKTLKLRLPRVLLPFLVWSLAAAVYYLLMKYFSTGEFDITEVTGRIKRMPAQPATIHLWFMYALIPLYIISPILKKLVDSLTRELVIYMMAIWLFFSSILPTAADFLPDRYKPLLTLNVNYNLNFMSGYIGYFLAGYFLMHYQKRISKGLLLAVIIADTIVIAAGTWARTSAAGQYSEFYKAYPKSFTLVLSIAVFLLFKELFRDLKLKGWIKSITGTLSALSYGVYLIHNLIIDFITRKIAFGPENSLMVMMNKYAAVLVASLLIIILLSSIKPLSFIFTGLTYKDACEICNLQYFFRRIGISIPYKNDAGLSQ